MRARGERGSEHLEFVELSRPVGARTKKWKVEAVRGGYLGQIYWRSGWRRYVFEPIFNTIYDASCLEDISDFLKGKDEEQRRHWKGRQHDRAD